MQRSVPEVHCQHMKFKNPYPTAYSEPAMNTQSEFDYFYSIIIGLLNQFYPERTITFSSRDPEFITPEIKSKLRRKNRLMRAGRVEEAGALAVRIGKDMARHSKSHLNKIDGKANTKDMWTAVRQLTGKQQEPAAVDKINTVTK